MSDWEKDQPQGEARPEEQPPKDQVPVQLPAEQQPASALEQPIQKEEAAPPPPPHGPEIAFQSPQAVAQEPSQAYGQVPYPPQPFQGGAPGGVPQGGNYGGFPSPAEAFTPPPFIPTGGAQQPQTYSPPPQAYGQPPQAYGQQQQGYQQSPAPQPGPAPTYPPTPYGQTAQAYPQPAWYGAPAYGTRPPKKKMPLGLKVFLWIFSALFAGTILGFTGFLTFRMMSPSQVLLPQEIPAPYEDIPVESPPPVVQPDVELTPNKEGIAIAPKSSLKELSAQEVYERVVKSTVTVQAYYGEIKENPDSTGTGIIATSDGYIITNSHVVLNLKSSLVKVTTYDGQEYDAVVVGTDRTTDLAVLKTNDHQFTPAEFGDAGELAIGEWAVAIGNPGGARFSGSLTRGVISGLDRVVDKYSENGMTYIQTDAPINPGNSGGPLVNMFGQVVGINSSKIVSSGYEGMGFAIPVSKAQSILNDLLSGGYVKGRVRLGIQGKDITEPEAMLYGVQPGFMISRIDEDSAFHGSGAQVGDIIVGLGGQPATSLNDLSNLLLKYTAGDTVEVELLRPDEGKGTSLTVSIVLLEDKGETQK